MLPAILFLKNNYNKLEIQSWDILIYHLVTSPSKLMYYRFFLSSFLQRLLSPNYSGYNYENSNKRFAINIFIVALLVSGVFV